MDSGATDDPRLDSVPEPYMLPTFVWHPEQDDLYSLMYGSQSLDGPPSGFNKDFGHAFTMEAKGEALTLSPIATESDIFVAFGAGGNPDFQPARIIMRGGTFQVLSDPVEDMLNVQFGDGQYESKVAVHLTDDSVFRIKANVVVAEQDGPFAVPVLNIDLRNTSFLDIECSLYSVVESSSILNEAQMAVLAHDRAMLGPTSTINVMSSPSSGASWAVSVRGDSKGGPADAAALIIQPDVRILAGASASLLIQTPLLIIQNGASLTVQQNARCGIACSSVTPSTGAFVLGRGYPMLMFSSGSPGAPIFDFANTAYPQGIFNFVTTYDGGRTHVPNYGSVQVQGHPDDLPLMLAKRLIYKDGVPALPGDIGYRNSDGNLTFFLAKPGAG